MIISHRLKFAFFANPKTGSKAAGIILRMAGVFNENDIMVRQPFLGTRTAQIRIPQYGSDEYIPEHITPEGCIERGFITLEQLRSYSCYAFIREPEERFYASRIAMQLNRHGEVSNGQPIEQPHYPQHSYFLVDNEQVVTPLNFDRYDVELKRMLVELKTPYRHMDIPDIVMKRQFETKSQYVSTQHSKDIQLYKRMLRDEIHST